MAIDGPPAATADAPGSGGTNGGEGGGGRLFDRLSAAGQRLAPVLYRFIATTAAEAQPPTRLAESRHHRAAGYVCHGFHKPISKCRRGEAGRE
jgi:hypothetical protein